MVEEEVGVEKGSLKLGLEEGTVVTFEEEFEEFVEIRGDSIPTDRRASVSKPAVELLGPRASYFEVKEEEVEVEIEAVEFG